MTRKSKKTPKLTAIDCEVILQITSLDPTHWDPTPEEDAAMEAMCSKGILIPRPPGWCPCVPTNTLAAFKATVEEARASQTMLSNDDSAIVCAIRQCPEYQFIREEAKAAKKLMADGVLRPANSAKRYLVTFLGYTRYDWDLSGGARG